MVRLFHIWLSLPRPTSRKVIDMLIAAVVAALVLGFLTGMLAFRVKSRWCPECGATTVALTAARAR
ncbi:MAG: hypothetical protein JWP76_9 [Dactylosporangium sp.]|nr:hypothetical protein [Dactylosporangium sp.]